MKGLKGEIMIIMSVHTTDYVRDNNWPNFPLTQAGTSQVGQLGWCWLRGNKNCSQLSI